MCLCLCYLYQTNPGSVQLMKYNSCAFMHESHGVIDTKTAADNQAHTQYPYTHIPCVLVSLGLGQSPSGSLMRNSSSFADSWCAEMDCHWPGVWREKESRGRGRRRSTCRERGERRLRERKERRGVRGRRLGRKGVKRRGERRRGRERREEGREGKERGGSEGKEEEGREVKERRGGKERRGEEAGRRELKIVCTMYIMAYPSPLP